MEKDETEMSKMKEEHIVTDGQTEIVTPWAPVEANILLFTVLHLLKSILFWWVYRFLRYLAFPLLFYVNKIVSWTRYCKPHQWSVCRFANIWTLFTLNIQILRQFNSRDGIYIYFSKADLKTPAITLWKWKFYYQIYISILKIWHGLESK